MLVIIKNTPVELPDLEAEILLRWGVANLPERADLPRLGLADPVPAECRARRHRPVGAAVERADRPLATRFESSGTQTPRSPQQGTEPKQHKSSKGSSKKNTK